jgi:Mn2+/Fe2+ NRAMP family transporter
MGTAMLWTAFITWPLMTCIQFMCARIDGHRNGPRRGALRRKIPRWLLFAGAVGLLVANTINVGADLSGMADDARRLRRIRVCGNLFVEARTRQSLRGAHHFYAALISSILLGLTLDFLNVNPVKALFWTAVINGVLAPFLLVGILIAASDRKLMQGQPSSWVSRILIGIVTLGMFSAAAAKFLL